MATMYLNDEACNRETEPLVHCETAYLLQTASEQVEVWHQRWQSYSVSHSEKSAQFSSASLSKLLVQALTAVPA